MVLVDTNRNANETSYILEFPNGKTQLELIHDRNGAITDPYQEKRTDNYWKYSLFVDDIQRVYHNLQDKNHVVGEAYQFGNIGYLSHTKDPENHQIEFIQKTFEKDTPVTENDSRYPLLESPVMGLITIRSVDPLRSIRFYEAFFEMKLYVRMYVDRGSGFTLYFLGRKGLNPPNPDMDAIENRTWMYQQNEPFIEIQYYWGSEYATDFVLETDTPLGFRGMVFKSNAMAQFKERFLKSNIPIETSSEGTIKITSPDGHTITIE